MNDGLYIDYYMQTGLTRALCWMVNNELLTVEYFTYDPYPTGGVIIEFDGAANLFLLGDEE